MTTETWIANTLAKAAATVADDTTMRGITDPAGTPASEQVTALALLAYILSKPDLAELIRDTIAAALVAGDGISITPNDGADTITVGADGDAITALDAFSSLALTDLFLGVQDPGGTPDTRQGTFAQVAALLIDDAAFSAAWNAVTNKTASQNALHDKFEGYLHPGYISANWYFLTHAASLANGNTLTTNRIYYHPFVVTRAFTITDLGARVQTNVASANFKIAIYANNASTGRPTGLPLAETGNMDGATTGMKTGDILSVASVTLTPGVYWAAVWSDSALAFIANATAAVMPFALLMGDAVAGTLLGGTTMLCGVYSDETYGSWPDATSETFTAENSSRFAVILAKAA